MIIQPSKEIYVPDRNLILPPKGLTIPKPRVPLQMMAPQGGSSYLYGVAGKRRTVSPYYPGGLEDDCVGYWPLGDGSDGYGDPTFTDHSSYGNHATNHGTVPFAQGTTFDGIDDYLNLTAADSLYPHTGDYTYFLWVKIKEKPATYYDRLLWLGIYSSTWLVKVHIQWAVADVKVSFAIHNPASTDYYASQHLSFCTFDEWVSMAFVVDRDVGLYVYKNGAFLAGPLGNLTTDDVQNISPLQIGKAGASTNDTWKGDLGESLWFNVAKTSVQVLDLHNFTKGRYVT